jgi:hypothetical protein
MTAQAKRAIPAAPTDQHHEPLVENFRREGNSGAATFVLVRCGHHTTGYRLAYVGALPEQVPKKEFMP